MRSIFWAVKPSILNPEKNPILDKGLEISLSSNNLVVKIPLISFFELCAEQGPSGALDIFTRL